MIKMATPVLDAAAQGKLRQTMAIEQQPGRNREKFSCFEGVARLLNGMAPWFVAEVTCPEEKALRDDLLKKAQQAIEGQVDPQSDDFCNYPTLSHPYSQILVDAAILAQGILRAPTALWEGLSSSGQANLIKMLQAASNITPCNNNWLLFSTEVQLLLRKITGACNRGVLTVYFNMLNGWYLGDGWYGDGPHFATDYYNSIIIHPMMLDLCDMAADSVPHGMPETVLKRAQRFAEILENLVAPDGSYIATGRSLAYRCGVFHLLAQLAWQKRLPQKIDPATARDVLYAVSEKTLTNGSYRADGFLNIGLKGADPAMGEGYVSTGSLYLASAAFFPLGLSDKDDFWTWPAVSWTQKRIWG
jgi:hypothetical protein